MKEVKGLLGLEGAGLKEGAGGAGLGLKGLNLLAVLRMFWKNPWAWAADIRDRHTRETDRILIWKEKQRVESET